MSSCQVRYISCMVQTLESWSQNRSNCFFFIITGLVTRAYSSMLEHQHLVKIVAFHFHWLLLWNLKLFSKHHSPSSSSWSCLTTGPAPRWRGATSPRGFLLGRAGMLPPIAAARAATFGAAALWRSNFRPPVAAGDFPVGGGGAGPLRGSVPRLGLAAGLFSFDLASASVALICGGLDRCALRAAMTSARSSPTGAFFSSPGVVSFLALTGYSPFGAFLLVVVFGCSALTFGDDTCFSRRAEGGESTSSEDVPLVLSAVCCQKLRDIRKCEF